MSGVAALTHEEMNAIWSDPLNGLQWDCLFMLPVWIDAWWDVFGQGVALRLLVTGENGALLGFAPLRLQDGTASFLGSADVCDYQDFVVAAGRETDFFSALCNELQDRGVHRLDLKPVRPDAAAGKIVAAARSAGYRVHCEADDLTVCVKLPVTWEEYLSGLTGKQRHEIRRKTRRLHEAGPVSYRVVESREDVRETLPTFLRLFRTSRADKADFMTARMERFFRVLVEKLSREHMIRLYYLELEGRPAAAVLCFDFQSTTYLYNSGYDPWYRSLSVGLLSKVFSLKDSIERGKRQFDFLKGSEPYKVRLGGKPLQLYRYCVDLQKTK